MSLIKYAGSKAKLLDFLIPQIKENLDEGKLFVDLFAGTCSVSYALKDRNSIFCNDVQSYSKTIADALILNNKNLSSDSVKADIIDRPEESLASYDLFTKIYSDTYFSKSQCVEIDKIRSKIDQIESKWKRSIYLVALMHSMSYCASTTGHFAEYLRIKNNKSITERFVEKCNSLEVKKGRNKHFSSSLDYKKIVNYNEYEKLIKKAGLIYADPPYSDAQYSRFYHVLETLIKYDYPEVEHQGKYRKDRFFSDFCRKAKVESEFVNLFKFASENSSATLMISYVNHGRGLLSETKLTELAKRYYDRIMIKRADYKHSKLGNKGALKSVEEFLLICK